MILKRIARKLGWTEEKKKELSDILSETATVSKNYTPRKDNLATGVALGTAMGNTAMGLALGSAMSHSERYEISFNGDKTYFSFDDEELYEQFQDGEKAKISYREAWEEIYDYIPPDFEYKRFITKKFSGHRFINAEKLKK